MTFDICNVCNRKTGRVFLFRTQKDFGMCLECWDKRVDYIKKINKENADYERLCKICQSMAKRIYK